MSGRLLSKAAGGRDLFRVQTRGLAWQNKLYRRKYVGNPPYRPPWGEVEKLPPANDPEYSGPGGWKERYIDRYRVIFDPKEHWFELALVPFVFYATFY
mmetsp:Transcript_4278/g.18260  ORF Transcript_4278/g.18260 Transcript_4278/m.18260 type:complete len:98 (-) Transcript_4278:1207-1500(-)